MRNPGLIRFPWSSIDSYSDVNLNSSKLYHCLRAAFPLIAAPDAAGRLPAALLPGAAAAFFRNGSYFCSCGIGFATALMPKKLSSRVCDPEERDARRRSIDFCTRISLNEWRPTRKALSPS